MTPRSLHVTEEDLVLHYYGETVDEAPIEQHLASCAECRHEFQRLQQALAIVEGAAFGSASVPEPGPDFERAIWARVAPHLAAQERHAPTRWWWRLFQGTPGWALAGGVAGLVLAAFVVGRLSTPAPPASEPAAASPNLAERVLMVAVVDHLDRSQMVLLELLNADLDESADLAAEQSRARELVAANRLYRQTAADTGDDATRAVLDELERVLLELANTPHDATREELDALRVRVASGGLLFKVRVVYSELLERERQRLVSGSQS